MIGVKELAGWCRRVAIMMNAGLDVITVVEREAGKYAHSYKPPGAAENEFVPPSSVKAPPVQYDGDDFDDPESRNFADRIRRRFLAYLENEGNRPRKPPVFLRSNMQKLCGYVAGRVREGASLYEAFSEIGGHFPKLFVPMIAVAERSGSMGETFAELARYYEYQLKLKREFWQMMIYPIFNLGAAVVVIVLYILIMGALGRTTNLLGMQFEGVFGALKFLSLCGGFVAGCSVIYYIFKHYISTGNNVFHFALNVLPKIGKAMRCFAMARFTWALSFTTKTGMDVNEAVLLGFDVAAYAPINVHQNKVLEQLEQGTSLHEAFSDTHGFSHEFLTYLQTGEQSGELPETLAKLSEEYTEQTKVHMKILSVACYFAVFFLMAAIMISFIFTLGSEYINTLKGVIDNPMGN